MSRCHDGRGMRMMLVIAAAGTATALAAPLPAEAGLRAAPLCANADADPARLASSEAADAVLCVLNTERRARGLGELRENAALRSAAQRFATGLGPTRRLGSRGRDGSTPLQRITAAGYAGGDAKSADV